MGRARNQRHSTKQHKRSARLRAHIGEEHREAASGDTPDVLALLHLGARSAHGPVADESILDRVVDELVRDGARNDPDPALSTELLRAIGECYERGWRPLDVVHIVRRRASRLVVRLAQHVVTVQALQIRADDVAPADWLEQLAMATGVLTDGGSVDVDGSDTVVVTEWRCQNGLTVAEGLYDALVLLGVLSDLPVIASIGHPPSQWGAVRRVTPAAQPAAADPKMLARIRALLAKAEGTTFTAEAEAFTAKAQDLMARHAIDTAVLLAGTHHDLRTDVTARRVHIDNPYAAEKVDLLAVVCSANGVRTVWHQGLGFATVVGLPVDLDVADLLFTSLLVQLNRAMVDATVASGHSRSRGFRRTFMLAYAHRIGERLEEAAERAGRDAMQQYGTALVPVLAARAEAVESEFQRLFPRTRTTRGRRLDPHGWAAGRAAADHAVLDEGRGRLRR